MWDTLITTVAFVFGIAAVFMVWIYNYQTKTLNRQLEGINNRLGILRQDLEAQQSATGREVFRLRSKLDELTLSPAVPDSKVPEAFLDG